MKNQEMIVLGLAGIAVYMILKSGGAMGSSTGRVINAEFLGETAQRYNTNPQSQQTRMLAEQDSWFY